MATQVHMQLTIPFFGKSHGQKFIDNQHVIVLTLTSSPPFYRNSISQWIILIFKNDMSKTQSKITTYWITW